MIERSPAPDEIAVCSAEYSPAAYNDPVDSVAQRQLAAFAPGCSPNMSEWKKCCTHWTKGGFSLVDGSSGEHRPRGISPFSAAEAWRPSHAPSFGLLAAHVQRRRPSMASHFLLPTSSPTIVSGTRSEIQPGRPIHHLPGRARSAFSKPPNPMALCYVENAAVRMMTAQVSSGRSTLPRGSLKTTCNWASGDARGPNSQPQDQHHRPMSAPGAVGRLGEET